MADKTSIFEQAGPTVQIAQSVREMKCYTVTDGELLSLSLANGLAVLFFSLASACATFGVDLVKDIALSPELTSDGMTFDHIIKPTSFILAFVFCLAGVGAVLWRRSMIGVIKRESSSSG